MSMFKPFKDGSWWLKSKSDDRWNASGSSPCVGGFTMPRECEEMLEAKKKLYGDPPDDLEWGYMKD